MIDEDDTPKTFRKWSINDVIGVTGQMFLLIF